MTKLMNGRETVARLLDVNSMAIIQSALSYKLLILFGLVIVLSLANLPIYPLANGGRVVLHLYPALESVTQTQNFTMVSQSRTFWSTINAEFPGNNKVTINTGNKLVYIDFDDNVPSNLKAHERSINEAFNKSEELQTRLKKFITTSEQNRIIETLCGSLDFLKNQTVDQMLKCLRLNQEIKEAATSKGFEPQNRFFTIVKLRATQLPLDAKIAVNALAVGLYFLVVVTMIYIGVSFKGTANDD